ncbi:neprilysin-2-like isoform X1 [Octopus sinensis]|uniref:Neprilysin-2-like isoform X1 n=1 Tax=Octopus sinensis TaxID=2607531 RepID=A0A7E6F211_9MOLL|nr:neprilysin-2-like isoform X1 [Octopus sinensis]
MIPTIGMYLADSISNLGIAPNYTQSNSNLSSIPAQKKTCLDIAYLASDVLGWLYSKKYFDKQVQEQAKDIAKYLERSLEKILSERKWLTQESRENAKNIIKKLSKKVHVGSQHSHQAEAKLIKRYENLKLSDNFLENAFALKKRRTQLITSDMLKNDMNQVSDMDIQAVYYVVDNSIHIPIAMLQPPVFYKGAPMALNFAGLGTLIGHEILHAFEADFESSYFNKKWLSDKSYENYDDLKEAVVKIYSGYRIESMNFTVNGERTAEENIADIGALKIAYEAYLLWKSDHPDAKKTLPILKMTDLQLFFMSFAQSWCSNVSPKEKYLFENAVHSPMEARVQVPLMNSKDFAEAFNCEKGSNMNPYVKSEMWAK